MRIPHRLVKTISGRTGTAKVYRDAEYDEYIVKIVDQGSDSWYHTDDCDDAYKTARIMVQAD